ncbi:MAG TPA: AGE family epimerase/isomerase [Chryseolinea sp.]
MFILKTKKAILVLSGMLILAACTSEKKNERAEIASAIEKSITTELLNKWYPAAMDTQYGGFLSTWTFDFKPTGEQDKMIVSQARHVWTNSKASEVYKDVAHYKACATHGFKFLRDVMWDKTYGGFYTLVDRQGKVQREDEIKTAYGNAFAIYALAAYHHATGDTSALKLAQDGFLWLEKHSHDPVYKGYFQHLKRDGTVIRRDETVLSTEDTGYKDQNSSIHLLEAFTELYQVWPDSLVGVRLKEMLFLIRDTIVNDKGSLVLFFQPDWTPVSFSDSSEAVIMKHRSLDHVSFGHDVETAYLMMEASHVAGITDDARTREVGKKMVDHSLEKGWDDTVGGFYDEGYYFKGESDIRITKDTKTWWAQAEGLNTLLIMADLFPEDEHRYFEKFEKMWRYIDTNLIDHEHGEWYPGGLDKEPQAKTALKGHIWKAVYHQYRAMANCVQRLGAKNAH